MSIQIAVRLPEDLVEFVDSLVSTGAASSRAAVVTAALEHERRRKVTERDLQILLSIDGEPYPELSGLADWSARRPRSDLD